MRLAFGVPRVTVWMQLSSFALIGFAQGAYAATTLPPNFRETTLLSGLTQPSVVRFAPDGRVFVAEKSGRILMLDNLSDTTAVVFADLRTQVYNFWDRGLLGMELDPLFSTSRPYIYVLYALDKLPGAPDSSIPKWGVPGGTSDPCPNPPGPTSEGCAVTGRLSRFQAGATAVVGAENVLITDWCQQFPSHSIGTLRFGPDALYVSGGDGASFTQVDYGQLGGSTTPVNVCGDPPTPVGTAPQPTTAEGGSLRSLSPQRAAGPAVLDGAILRIHPDTGAGLPGNPFASSADANLRRITAFGLRNPFRFTIRPGTNELWIGDVGWNTWEEINRVTDVADASNFGWPCYEGPARQAGYEALNNTICAGLYANGGTSGPYFMYNHPANVVSGESCPTGSSSISGLAFYQNGTYPAEYQGALFFADYSRKCVWAMMPGAGGLPDPNNIQTFAAGAGGPVELVVGPGGDLFYVDFDNGAIKRIRHSAGNNPPVADATATPTSGSAPLTVAFDGSGSSDPDPGDSLSYSWDLDGDGTFGDALVAQPIHTYEASGLYTVGLLVTDPFGATDTTTVQISVDNTPPTATISAPLASLTWKVGDAIAFSGSAIDPEQGQLPASALSWRIILQHCPSNCHAHVLQTFTGVTSGSFPAPDHDYPSHLEVELTATDAGGLSDTKTVAIQPQTVNLTFASQPTGLTLVVNGVSGTAPFSRTMIVGSSNSASAPSPQTLAGTTYTFASWSDGGAATHTITAPASATTYQANYASTTAVDLAITMTDAPDPVRLGNSLTYTLVVTNGSSATATGVTVTDTLPNNVEFLSASTGCALSGRSVTCAVGSLAGGVSRSLAIAVRPLKPGTLTNTAVVSGGEADPNTANNTALANTHVRKK